MTTDTSGLQPSPSVSGQQWRVQEHRIELRGSTFMLRLVRFPAGWLASLDTVDGPTLGCDSSPYLAVARALEPIGGALIDAMSIVAAIRPSDPMSTIPSATPPGQ
jgi:hypothetical protein